MAFQNIRNIEIAGVSACVPSNIEENNRLSLFSSEKEFHQFVVTTGVERRRVGWPKLCASDLCYHAAEQLIHDLAWDKNDIGCLIFVSHTPDYIHPATACTLQDRLGLSQECVSFDISLGCSGWVYGLTTIASMLSTGQYGKAILLAGDTSTATKSPYDKSTWPLFGDAGSATALQFREGARGIKAHLASDGAGYRAIIIEDGGFRNPVNLESFTIKQHEPGISSNRLHSRLDGMSVFSFGITKAPKSILALLNKFETDISSVDYFVLHQANQMMNERITKKLKIPERKTPIILKDFGNTSSSSIPLTMVCKLREAINSSESRCLSILACGFGVGLSWGSVLFELQRSKCSKLLEI